MYTSEKFIDISKEFKNKKNSHSYIFYTNDFFSCQKDVYELIKDIFNKESIENNYADLTIIKKSEKKSILKEDIAKIKSIFQNTSYLNKYRVYLIEETHKLNSTTSNMILKFLEEPLDGVIGLFITDNLDAVLETIKSRCQIVNVFYDKKNMFNISESIDELDKILFHSNKYLSIINIKKRYVDIDRNLIIDLFKKLLDNTILLDVNAENVKKIKILNEAITMLNNNVNIDYVFDYIFLKGSD